MIRDPQLRDLGRVWVTRRAPDGTPVAWGRSGLTGRKLTAREVFQAVYDADTTDADLAFTLTCVSFAECGGYEHARLVYTDSAGYPKEPYEADEGPFQIASRFVPAGTTAADIYTVGPAAALAREKLLAARKAGRHPLSPWYAYLNGSWLRWAPRGAQGVGNALLVAHGLKPVLSRPAVARVLSLLSSPVLPVRLRDHTSTVEGG